MAKRWNLFYELKLFLDSPSHVSNSDTSIGSSVYASLPGASHIVQQSTGHSRSKSQNVDDSFPLSNTSKVYFIKVKISSQPHTLHKTHFILNFHLITIIC